MVLSKVLYNLFGVARCAPNEGIKCFLKRLFAGYHYAQLVFFNNVIRVDIGYYRYTATPGLQERIGKAFIDGGVYEYFAFVKKLFGSFIRLKSEELEIFHCGTLPSYLFEQLSTSAFRTSNHDKFLVWEYPS